jgi:N-acetylmuramic acid 6-phosphate etherase
MPQSKLNLASLETEKTNAATAELDTLSTADLIKTLHAENHKVAAAVDPVLPNIAKVVDVVADRLAKGGRLFYVGAGTSGRLGVLDASECPPTFGVDKDLVQGIIAGGNAALVSSLEGVEDRSEAGGRDLGARGLSQKDVVIGIAASGRTPYVIGALDAARNKGAYTVAVVNVSDAAMAAHADITIPAVTGPEPITGSTRMKAGTAQKLVLNLISSATMVRLGKVYGNLMVDVRAASEKLVDRAARIVMSVAQVDRAEAEEAIREANGHAKTAIVMLRLGLSAQEAVSALAKANGQLRKTLGAETNG